MSFLFQGQDMSIYYFVYYLDIFKDIKKINRAKNKEKEILLFHAKNIYIYPVLLYRLKLYNRVEKNKNYIMIKSILDTDLYKTTMMYAILVNPELMNLKVRYQFFNRNDVEFPEGYDKVLQSEVNRMKNLRLTKQEKKFLIEKIYFLPLWFFDFLEGYQFDPSEVVIKQVDGKLFVDIEGFWFHSILWEVPLLALISELYYEITSEYDFKDIENRQIRLENNRQKAELMLKYELKVSEFGTRRRFSFDNQNEVIQDLKQHAGKSLIGTSNIYLGMLHDLSIQGTSGHEFFMVSGILNGYISANKKATDYWVNAFRGNLGSLLTDTYSTNICLKTFDTLSGNLYNSCRHDSGDPYEYVDKIVNHYKKLHIDHMTKTIIFSDGINIPLAIEIDKYCKKVGIKDSFGVGTNLSNNLKGVKPLNIVIKITEVFFQDHWFPCVKLSDNFGKHTGKIEEIKRCKEILNINDIIYDKQPSGNEGDVAHINLIN
jgi:nicotinate phosphoribosyltransferase